MMARSKKVLAVLGMLCVDEGFRAWFFTTPRDAAAHHFGALTEDELRQIDKLGRRSKPPKELQEVYDVF